MRILSVPKRLNDLRGNVIPSGDLISLLLLPPFLPGSPERHRPDDAAGGRYQHPPLPDAARGRPQSVRPRHGIVFQCRVDDAFQMAGGIWMDTGLMISGQRRERLRCDAGLLRLPKSHGYP